MKRGAPALLIVAVGVFVLTGCGDFQQRAAEIQTRIVNAEERAHVAEDAAASNTGRILELERRVNELEAALDRLQTAPAHDGP
jgi:uncharacterized protein (DUF3084 family)